jgi:GntR family transcriptional regulator/MocR family aminotransferase
MDLQTLSARFMEEGYFARHVRRVRVLYQWRQRALLEAASRELDGVLKVEPMQCGMHVVGRFLNDLDDREATEKAARHGVITHPLSAYYMGKQTSRGLLLGYASFHEKEIKKGVTLLARALRL